MMETPITVDGLLIAPATPERWEDLTRLFGEHGASSGCWDMFWRIPRKEYARQSGEGNRQALQALVEGGTITGLMAYREGEPIGWCSLGPREAYPILDRSPVLKRLDDLPVWSIVCFFIAKTARRQGNLLPLLKGALEYARQQGAKIVEAYPLESDRKMSADESYMGRLPVFEQAGFRVVSSPSAHRRVMRVSLE